MEVVVEMVEEESEGVGDGAWGEGGGWTFWGGWRRMKNPPLVFTNSPLDSDKPGGREVTNSAVVSVIKSPALRATEATIPILSRLNV